MAAKKKTTAAQTNPEAPAGMTSVTTGFTVADIQKSVNWYREVLGFAVNERWESNGRLEAAEICSGGVSFFLAQDDWRKGRNRVKGEGVRIYCVTPRNVDAFAKHVRGTGTPLTQPPCTEMGMRSFSVDDPDGYQLTIWGASKR